MGNAYTHYWVEKHNDDLQGKPLRCVSSNEFRERHIVAGDKIYCVTQHDGKLFLIARMIIDKVASTTEASKFLGWKVPYADRADHCVCSPAHGSPILFDRELTIDVANQLRFEREVGKNTRISFAPNGTPRLQTLRKVRRLTPDSAATLDRLIGHDAPNSIELASIKTFDQLAENFHTFQREARNHRSCAVRILALDAILGLRQW